MKCCRAVMWVCCVKEILSENWELKITMATHTHCKVWRVTTALKKTKDKWQSYLAAVWIHCHPHGWVLSQKTHAYILLQMSPRQTITIVNVVLMHLCISQQSLNFLYSFSVDFSFCDCVQLRCRFKEDCLAPRPLWRVPWPLTILCSNSLWLLLPIPSSLTLTLLPLCSWKVQTHDS